MKDTISRYLLAAVVFLATQAPVTAASQISTAADNLLKGTNYMTGCNTEYYYGNQYSNLNPDINLLQRDGIHWARVELPVDQDYSQIQPYLQSAQRAKIHTLLNILCSNYSPSNEESRTSYKTWLKKTVEGLGNQVMYYEICDEENLSQQSEGGGPYGWAGLPEGNLPYGLGPCPNGPTKNYTMKVQDYVALLQDSYGTIKRVNPNITVIIGGLSSWHCSCYLKTLTMLKAYNYADAIAFHPYDNNPQMASNDVTDPLQKTVNSWPRRLPIWITEFGYQTTSPNYGSYVPGSTLEAREEKKGQWIAETYELMRERNQISTPIFLYTARDINYSQPGYVQCGIFERDGKLQLLPSYWAYQHPLVGAKSP